MPPVLTQEAPPGRIARARAALRSVTLVQWVLSAMLLVGGLAFLRAFAGGEGVAAQRLAWASLAWTFPLLWDLTAVIGSTLWIAAPRKTAAFRWGVFLNLAATVVSGLATGSQAYTLARDQVPQGWPVPAFVAGAAVPLLYSILTWAAASARAALTNGARAWSTSWTASAEGSDGAASVPPAAGAPTVPAGSATPPAVAPAPWTSSETQQLLLPRTGPPSTAPPSDATGWTQTATAPTPSPSASPQTDPPSGSAGSVERVRESLSASAGAGTPTPGASGPTPSEPSPPGPPPSTGPATPQDGRSPAPGAPEEERPRSTPDERRQWAVAELYRRAEAPDADQLRPRDVDQHFGTKDGWRIVSWAEDRFRRERVHDVPNAAGAES